MYPELKASPKPTLLLELDDMHYQAVNFSKWLIYSHEMKNVQNCIFTCSLHSFIEKIFSEISCIA